MPTCTDCNIQVERGTSETSKCAFSGYDWYPGRGCCNCLKDRPRSVSTQEPPLQGSALSDGSAAGGDSITSTADGASLTPVFLLPSGIASRHRPTSRGVAYGWSYDKDGCRHCKARRQNGQYQVMYAQPQLYTCKECGIQGRYDTSNTDMCAAYFVNGNITTRGCCNCRRKNEWELKLDDKEACWMCKARRDQDALWQGLPHLTHPASLQGAGKKPEGAGTTDKGKQPAAQKQRTRTTSQATQPQQPLLAADAFVVALEAVPAEDWCRTWVAGRTIMLRKTSKRVKEVVDKMRLPAVIRLSRSFWDDARNGIAAEKLQFVFRQLTLMTGWCCISRLELPRCEMKGQDAEILAAVLAQCPALAHLDLSENYHLAAGGPQRLAGVLRQ